MISDNYISGAMFILAHRKPDFLPQKYCVKPSVLKKRMADYGAFDDDDTYSDFEKKSKESPVVAICVLYDINWFTDVNPEEFTKFKYACMLNRELDKNRDNYPFCYIGWDID